MSAAIVGQHIGQYKVLREIGEGGMGVVYAARRNADHELVAIKVVKRGTHSRDVADRFRRERRILSRLNHPNIAALLDGGALPDGRPYFVMEYVEGLPFIEHCEHRRLSTRRRIQLFRNVCAAVEFAHQNLIVHRDLKPANILVNSSGQTKLLDFGIAKILEPECAADAITAPMLTPDYASPEQVRGEPASMTADVYSLGAVLYELLTGRKPHEFRATTPAEIERVICQTEPLKPSTVVSRRDDLPKRARVQLRKSLSGDLDNIVLKAMASEPERRYQTVEELSADLQAYTEGRPVSARPDTLLYRARKFVSRNRVPVAACAVVAASMVLSIVITTYQARIAQRRFEQVHQLAAVYLFDVYAKILDVPGSVPLREQIIRTAIEYFENLRQDAGSDRRLAAELATAFQRIGEVQGSPFVANLGDTAEALKSFRKSLEIRQDLIRSDPADSALRLKLTESHFGISDILTFTGDTSSAIEEVKKGIAVVEADRGASLDNPERYRILAGAYNRIGDQHLRDGSPGEALDAFQRGLVMHQNWRQKLAGSRPQFGLAVSYARLGDAYERLGSLEEAIRNVERAVALREQLFRSDPSGLNRRYLIIAYIDLGHLRGNPLQINEGNPPAAVELYRKGLALAEDALSSEPENAQARNDIALLKFHLGMVLHSPDPRRSVAMIREAIAITTELSGDAGGGYYGRNLIIYCLELARLLRKIQDFEAASDELTKVAELLKTGDFAGQAQDQWSFWLETGDLHFDRLQYQEAEAAWSKGRDLMRASVPSREHDIGTVRQRADLLLQMARLARIRGQVKAACTHSQDAVRLWQDAITRAGTNVYLKRQLDLAREHLRGCP